MDLRRQQLAATGYEIVWMAGDYCRACRNSVDFLLRWDGSQWRLL